MAGETLDFESFVRLVVDVLEAAGINYLIGGALAAWEWGEPRATQDIDIVIALPDDAIERLSDELKKQGMLVPPDIMRSIIAETRVDLAINAVHPFSGYRAELFPLRPGDALRRSALSRRVQVDFGGKIGRVYIHTPEDLILYKLRYYAISRQTKHTRDIASILKASKPLDHVYIEEWAGRLGVSDLWREVQSHVGGRGK